MLIVDLINYTNHKQIECLNIYVYRVPTKSKTYNVNSLDFLKPLQ
jgi:hypothetical protein